MANIKDIYEDAERQVPFFPRTHTKAVIDDNGNTVESKFGQIEDLVNQKQMEVGAVPSDTTPTAGSTHWVTSGGLFNEMNVFKNDTTDNLSYYRLQRNTRVVIGAEGGYDSSTVRVSIPLPQGTVSVTFNSITSGYHVGLQEWYTSDPQESITTMSGTVTADSGWIESTETPTTITKNANSNYLVVCIGKTNERSITISEAESAVSFIFTLLYNKFNNIDEQIGGLHSKIYGKEAITEIDNDNASSSNWTTYTASGGSRGRFYVSLDGYDFNKYRVSFNVAQNSTIKVGSSLMASLSNVTTYLYDTGWILPEQGFSYNNTKDEGNAAHYIIFNTTYVDSPSSATTFEEFLQYCTFSVELIDQVDGLIPAMEELEMQKCLLASTNIKMVAHRGFHLNGIPENSLDAYRWAGYMGYDLAETDFCPTADDELVLMHDASINRTMKNASDYSTISGTVNVVSKTLAELQTDYVLASDDPRYRRPIPTLEEYFVTCRESNLFPIPEIKSSGTTQAHVLAAYNLGKQIMGLGNFGFCSFSYELLDYARSLDAKIPLWYIGNSILGTTNSITGESRETPETVWYPSYNGYSFSASVVKQYREKGMQVAVWTVPVSEFDNMLKSGVDYIATDTIGSNLCKTDGKVYDETDMTTFGATGVNGITLDSGQYATIVGENLVIGLYYVSIIAKGEYTITAPNLSETINDSDYTRRVWQGVADNKYSTITITAVTETIIQFVNAKVVIVR